MRKALVVGINHYQNIKSLEGCVNDAERVEKLLKRDEDGAPNFGTKLFLSKNRRHLIERTFLKDQIEELFNGGNDVDVALFYFAGHGHVEDTGGYLITSECSAGDSGVSMHDILLLANKSEAQNKIIILDCCYSGAMGDSGYHSVLGHGMTVLAASTKDQKSKEKNASGVFTELLVDALNGGAANLVGNITPGSVYAHIDQSLGSWDQRPIFKTNVQNFVSLRKVNPPLPITELREISELFETKNTQFRLDPSYESREKENSLKKKTLEEVEENIRKFKILQHYNRTGLLVPVDAEHMYDAAMESKFCELTALGKHYWNLGNEGKL